MAERDFGSVRIGNETGDKRTIRPCPSTSLKMNSGKVLVTKTMWNNFKEYIILILRKLRLCLSIWYGTFVDSIGPSLNSALLGTLAKVFVEIEFSWDENALDFKKKLTCKVECANNHSEDPCIGSHILEHTLSVIFEYGRVTVLSVFAYII